jgi:hypothetical protein
VLGPTVTSVLCLCSICAVLSVCMRVACSVVPASASPAFGVSLSFTRPARPAVVPVLVWYLDELHWVLHRFRYAIVQFGLP